MTNKLKPYLISIFTYPFVRMLSTPLSLYSDDMTGHKTGTGLLFRPEAHDERMYATFLKQEVRYTRNIFQFTPCPWIIIFNCDLFAVRLILWSILYPF